MINRLVEGEPPAKPLSDSKLAQLLNDQGIDVARRTVAKYREALNIPSSSRRKRLM
ncbi:MAG: RNA polymerase factor sigma-54, partial [Pseudomonadota bacterium]